MRAILIKNLLSALIAGPIFAAGQYYVIGGEDMTWAAAGRAGLIFVLIYFGFSLIWDMVKLRRKS